MIYDKPIWNPLKKGDAYTRWKHYEDNCPPEIKEFCKAHTWGTDTNEYDVVVYATKGNLALAKHPAGSYWSGIGATSYSSGWIVLIDKTKGKREEGTVWDNDPEKDGRPKKADIQALVDKYLGE